MRKWAETVKGHGEKIADRSARMAEELRRDVERLDAQIAAMRTAETACVEYAFGVLGKTERRLALVILLTAILPLAARWCSRTR